MSKLLPGSLVLASQNQKPYCANMDKARVLLLGGGGIVELAWIAGLSAVCTGSAAVPAFSPLSSCPPMARHQQNLPHMQTRPNTCPINPCCCPSSHGQALAFAVEPAYHEARLAFQANVSGDPRLFFVALTLGNPPPSRNPSYSIFQLGGSFGWPKCQHCTPTRSGPPPSPSERVHDHVHHHQNYMSPLSMSPPQSPPLPPPPPPT